MGNSMLLNLHVKNMALIRELDIDFGKGLNILTGETGAGKSILIGSINVALGMQSFKGFAREDETSALVELVFSVEDPGLKEKIELLDIPVEDGQVIECAGAKIRVIHTPGHTIGGCCYYLEEENALFSGDTLFCASVGRTDLPTGSMSAIVRSIAEKLLVLPEDIMVYPGHGDATTIGYEKQYNPVAAYVRKRGVQA